MKKYVILIFFIALNNNFSVELLKKKASYDLEYNVYEYEDFGGNIKLSWDSKKNLLSEWHRIGNKAFFISYKNKNIYFIENECFLKNQKTNEINEYLCGKSLVFDKNEKISKEVCYTPTIIDPDISAYDNEKCGTEIQYQPDGTKKIIEHKRRCKDPCELHFVKRHQGLYTVFVDALRVREKPSEKSKTLFTIYKNQEVELLEDTQIFFKVDFYVAPWVKIKTKNGRIGYVYGAFLKTKELYVEK